MRFGVLADLHWSVAYGASAGWHAPYDFAGLARRCEAVVASLVASGCDAIVVAGDVTHDGDRPSCETALASLAKASPIPVVVVAGNHDLLREPALVAGRGDVRDGWRGAEALASEELIVLRAIGADRDDRFGRDRSSLGPADGVATVVVSHYPLVPHAERLAAAGLPFPGERAHRDLWLGELAATRMPTVVLSGHVHVRDASCHGNVLQICVPALVEWPHEAALVEVDPLRSVVRCRRIRSEGPVLASAAEPWLLAPADERWRFVDGAWIDAAISAPVHPVLAEV